MGAWQVSWCYQRKPGKDLNGSITTDPIIKALASPVAILASRLIYRLAASVNAAHFLDALEERMPFPVKAIQVDGGSGCDQESGNRRQFPDGKHTLKHVRDIWQTKIFDRSTYNTWEAQGKESAFDKATEMAGWILANHKPIPLEPGVAQALRRIVEAAQRNLIK